MPPSASDCSRVRTVDALTVSSPKPSRDAGVSRPQQPGFNVWPWIRRWRDESIAQPRSPAVGSSPAADRLPSFNSQTFPMLHRLRLSLLAASLAAGLSGSARAQVAAPPAAPAPAVVKLTVADCIRLALAKNFTVQIQRYNVANARDSLEIAKATFDPTVSLTSTRTFSQSSNTNTQLNGAPAPVSDSTNTRVGVSQEIATGGTVSVSTLLNRSSSNSSFNLLNPAYSGNVTLAVSQPLLKGAGSSIARAAVERSQIGVTVANLNFQAQVLNVIQSTENAYYSLVYADEQLKVYELSLDLAQKLLSEAEEKKRIGTATDVDVLQAQVGVATARRNVLQAGQSLRDGSDALLALIGQFDLDQNIATAGFDAFSGAIPLVTSVYQAALTHQPDFLAAKIAIEQTQIDVRVARNQKRPDLSVGGALGYSGLDTSASSVYQDIPKGNSYNWQLNLALSFPWKFRGDTARYHQALAALNQQQTGLRQLEQNILVQVRSAVRSVETNSEGVKIAAVAADYSSKQYDLERARFEAGLATSRDVLQTQSDLETARVAELQARITLQNSLSTLHRLEGSSLERYHIVVPE
jgi:outer membrane protein